MYLVYKVALGVSTVFADFVALEATEHVTIEAKLREKRSIFLVAKRRSAENTKIIKM